MVRSIIACLCLVIVHACFSASEQNAEAQKLIDQINTKQDRARSLIVEAESKRAKAKEKTQPADRSEHEKLIDNAAELAKLKTPSWYQEYFIALPQKSLAKRILCASVSLWFAFPEQ